MFVRIVVGDWSTTIDSNSPYYDTIFSAMEEVPNELVFDKTWTWFSEQWSKWEVLQERLDRCGTIPPTYESPVIYYEDISLLAQAFLDLPDYWRSFVALRNSREGENETYFELVGKYSRRADIMDKSESNNLRPITLLDTFIRSSNLLGTQYNTLIVGYHDINPIRYDEDSVDYMDVIETRLTNHRNGTSVVEYDRTESDHVRNVLRGVLDNAIVSTQHDVHMNLWWNWLRGKVVVLRDRLRVLEGRASSTRGHANDLIGDEEDDHGLPSIQSLFLYTGHLSIRGRGWGNRQYITNSLDTPYNAEGITLHPEVYARALECWHNHFPLFPRSLCAIDNTVLTMEEWPRTVHIYLVERVTTLYPSAATTYKRISFGILSVIGRRHGETIANVSDVWKDDQKIHKRMKEQLVARDDIPDEMVDFHSEEELDHYLERTLLRVKL